jgi:hypothetical protein
MGLQEIRVGREARHVRHRVAVVVGEDVGVGHARDGQPEVVQHRVMDLLEIPLAILAEENARGPDELGVRVARDEPDLLREVLLAVVDRGG